MVRRARKKRNLRGETSSAKARESNLISRLDSISGYDFDERHAKEVEERIRRMTNGHKVEK